MRALGLALILLIALSSTVTIYYSQKAQNDEWQKAAQQVQIESDRAQIKNDLAQIASLQNQMLQLLNRSASQSASYQSQIAILQSQIVSLQNSIIHLQAQLRQPTLWIWGITQQIPTGSWLIENVPDTFDYHDSWVSSGSLTVYYLDDSQYVQFANCNGAIGCVSGTYYLWGPNTKANDTFTLGEGCAGYLVIYYQNTGNNVAIYPDVSVTYNPAANLTGVCNR